MTILSSLFETVGGQLDGIIDAYRRKKPLPPETIVEYANGSISSFNIEGELGENSITDKENVVEIEIGTDVTSFGDYAFFGCTNLTSIMISDGVTSIGSYVFSDCPRLASITVDSNNSVYDSRNNCKAIIKTSDNILIAGCKNTVIPNGITSIWNTAFIDCSGLMSITIPDSVTNIGNCAFQNCSSLTSVMIPSNVTSIGFEAFDNCSALTSITIPDSITSIGKSAFAWSGLTSIVIPNSLTSIRDYVFSNCSGLTSITIGNGVTSIGHSAFSGCTALSSITSHRTSAPTVQSDTFGSSTSNYTGRNTYSSGNNVLKVPQGATGYNTSYYWLDPLQNSTKCGFHIEYI